jgi:NADH-quinone oxidoreductase subunit L
MIKIYEYEFSYEYVIIIAPFITYCMISLFQNGIGTMGAKIIISFTQLITLILTLIILGLQIESPTITLYNFGELINIDFFKVDVAFTFDSITIIALTVIQIISTLVIIYSFEYMKDDERLSQFLANLSFFLGTMEVLVTSSNFLVLFIGWEGVD